MEKRCNRRTGDDEWWEACRKVLWSGLQQNKDAPALLQAWGLLEMQVGGGCVGGEQSMLDYASPCLQKAALGSRGPPLTPACVPPSFPRLQRGNWVAAILLLDRSALLEPRNRPVLR